MNTCRVCGKGLIVSSGKGRPRETCSRDCSDVVKFFNALDKSASNVNFSTEYKKLFIGELFRLANKIRN